MFRAEPVTQVPVCAAPGWRPVLQACCITLLAAGVLCAPVLKAQAPDASPAAPPKEAAPTQPSLPTQPSVPSLPPVSSQLSVPSLPSEFVGQEICATCHEEVARKFASNPHTKMALMHGSQGVTCENCHGAGKAHVEGGGDVTKIFNPAKATAKEVDAKCQSCHAGAHPNFGRSPHAKANVSCLGCHSVHADNGQEHLVKAEQPKLCFQCHNDVKPAFAMPFHHKVNEGLVTCNDCHDVHGSFGNNNIKSTADQNAICTKCHTETRGPFVFEHAAVKAEGCVGCHTPHGSQNARLLNMPTINTLCNQCHSPVAAGTVHGLDAGSASATPCISCHTMVHGSNLSQAFIR